MIVGALKPLAVPIDSVRPDPRNARVHPPRNLEAIKKSLEYYGQRKPIVVNAAEDNRIIAGNGLWQAAKELGWTEIAAVFVEDDPATATGYALMDNQSALLAEWDFGQLEELIEGLREEDFALELTGFDMGDLDFIEPRDIEADDEFATQAIDKAEELRKKWGTERGQIWEIPSVTVPGRVHRVMCGDSTSKEDVRSLMAGAKANMVFTDPPYGVKYTGGTKAWSELEGDKSPALYAIALPLICGAMGDRAALYLCFADCEVRTVYRAVEAAGFEVRALLIWNKNHAQFGAMGAHYKQKHEPILYCARRCSGLNWYGPSNEVTVWDIPRAAANEWHSAQKPVELAARAVRNSSVDGDVVADFFLGSGTTMIACEQLGRICYGMEIEPKYVAVTLERLAQLGLNPRLTGMAAK